MSSRALRKAQKEREKLERDQKLATNADAGQDEEPDDDGDDDNDNAAASAVPSKASAFELLSQMDDDGAGATDEEDDDDAAGQDAPRVTQAGDPVEAADDGDDGDPSAEASQRKPQPSSRKKKKKTKKGGRGTPQQQSRPDTSGVDDVDAALSAAALTDKPADSAVADTSPTAIDEEVEVCPFLSIDPHHLQIANEMKRLFGRAAFDVEAEERTQTRAQTRPNESVGLADAVSGRYATGGPGLPAMLRRRNIFVQGNEEWPRQTGNGLSMEIESKSQTGITTYRFVHTAPYITIQSLFAQFVAMMDPTNLISLLRSNPYHISTLLQVSEIAKQERDHAASGELLERALFAFGKALHPSFAANLSQGKARLDFRRPENREFFLAAFRYITNIGMRATWRTAYEWAKLLLSVDPSGDHYCMHLIIDQLAIRAKQAKNFSDIALSKFFTSRWSGLANIQYSLGLARKVLDGQSSPASQDLLRQSIQSYPWVAARLLQELGVDRIPPAVWGTTPATDKDTLHSELYATLGQDIWKPADAKALLLTATTSLAHPASDASMRPNPAPITLDEARLVILVDRPPLIGLLPRALTNRIETMSDPLRPDDNRSSYQVHTPAPETAEAARGSSTARTASNAEAHASHARAVLADSPARFINELAALQEFFQNPIQDEHGLASERSGVPHGHGFGTPLFSSRLGALVAFREELERQPGRRVRRDDGAVMEMEEGGSVRMLAPEGGLAGGGDVVGGAAAAAEEEQAE